MKTVMVCFFCLVFFSLDELRLEDFTELYRGSQPLDNQVIAQFDPTLLVNGTYQLLLQARDSNDNVNGQLVSVVVEGDLKVGHFSFTVEDLHIPLAGIPIAVTRTYDSRRRHEALDFGYGWESMGSDSIDNKLVTY